jgi:hypothetical protein
MPVSCTPGGSTTTGILGLCKPAAGETGWAPGMNGNMDSLDTQISAMPRVLDRDVTPNDVVNTAVETTVYSFLVAAGLLGTTRALRLTLIGDYLNTSVITANALFTVKVTYGGVILVQAAATLAPQAGQRRAISLDVILSAANAANAQVSKGTILYGQLNGAGGSPAATLVAAHWLGVNNAVGVDSAVAQTLAVTFTHQTADPGTSARALAVQLELL